MSKIILIFLVLLLPSLLLAKVARFTFEELVHRSDFIIYGEAFSVRYNEDYSGEAKLKVISVLKGAYLDDSITYKWDASSHSRDIDRAAQRYVIFVRYEDGNYVSTVYGAGVWNVYQDVDDYAKSVVANDFIHDVPPELLECVRFCNEERPELKITLDRLFVFFDKTLPIVQSVY